MPALQLLTIAGHDPSGGAGVVADLNVFRDYGHFGMSVITALTAQNSMGVESVWPVPEGQVQRQLEVILEDIAVQGVKVGMIGSRATLVALVKHIAHLAGEGVPVVLDPILSASRGNLLVDPSTLKLLMKVMLPVATVITPNLHEAGVIAGIPVRKEEDMYRAAQIISQMGARAVLVKGGHLKTRAMDLLYDGGKFTEIDSPLMEVGDVHGTGCRLSAAILASLAEGDGVRDACLKAKEYLLESLAVNLMQPGSGMTYFGVRRVEPGGAPVEHPAE